MTENGIQSTLTTSGNLRSPSDGYKDNAYIHTQEGRFYALKPTWNVHAIAHSLGQRARYSGHSDEFFSIAEHAVLVSLLMQEITGGDPYEGLHHDDTESVLPDVPSPFKQLFPDLRKFDGELDTDMRKTLGLPATKTDLCKKADWLALFIEAAQILPERGLDFEDPHKLRPVAMDLRADGWRVSCLDWKTAKATYLLRHQQLDRLAP